jgi:hypothetical protein
LATLLLSSSSSPPPPPSSLSLWGWFCRNLPGVSYVMSKVIACIQKCIPLSHQLLDAFLEEFWRLLLFHLSVQLESVSLKCLLQCPKMWKSWGRGLTGPYVRLLVLHLLLNGVRYVGVCIIVHLSAPVFHCLFWYTSISIHDLHLPMNIHWLTALCAQKINHSMLILLGWMWSMIRHIL